MQELVDAAVGFPTVTFTPALVVVAGMWLLILVGKVSRGSRGVGHSGGNAGVLDGGEFAVAARASLVIVLTWVISLSASVMLRGSEISGPLHTLLAVIVLVGSPVFAYGATRARPVGQRGRGARTPKP